MSEPGTPARPRQLTMAGGFVIGGSVLLLLTVFDAFTSLRSVEMRAEVTELLTSPTGRGLGLDVSEALSLMRGGLMVAGASAAAAAVLGVYALQRHRAARLALSVLAVPILLTAPLTGGLVGALVVGATAMLWSGPARDWFAGRPVREPAERPAAPRRPLDRPQSSQDPQSPQDRQPPASSQYPTAPAGRDDTPAVQVSTAGASTAPAATSGFGERAVEQRPEIEQNDTLTSPTGPRTGSTPMDGPAVPRTVKAACVLTWVFSGVVALLYAGMLVALAAAQDRIVDYITRTPEWQRANLDSGTLLPVLWLGILMFLGWAVGACVLAWFTWRRHNWARWLLVASAGTTVLVALFAFPFGLVHQLAAVAVIVCLVSASAKQWFGSVAGPQGGPPGPAPPSEHEQAHDQGQPPVW